MATRIDNALTTELESMLCDGLEGPGLASCILRAIKVEPYTYSAYTSATAAVMVPSYLSEVKNTPDAVSGLVVEYMTNYSMRDYQGKPLQTALHYEKMVNRYYFLEDELKTGAIWMTMSMTMQTMALTVLLSKVTRKDNAIVLFSGCGLGDWAASAALALGANSQVWCINYGRGITDQSMGYFLRTKKEDMFDVDMAPDATVAEIHRGVRLRWACLEPLSGSCIGQRGAGSLLTRDIDAISRELEVQGLAEAVVGRVDAVVFGNSIKPNELAGIRAALADDGFALIPICSSYKEAITMGGADSYCQGYWWQLGKNGNGDAPGSQDRKLWFFGSTMRPIGADSDRVPEHVRRLWE